MKSRFGKGGAFAETDNPMDGVANLADVMLVLACGLMLALVINWNVDIAPKTDEPRPEDLRETVSDVELTGSEGENLDSDTEFEELGVVYRDPATGKLYLVESGAG
ncbi:MAG: DUF2149 domain-containing protein [Oscillospiraceae bacterium]|jgi:hypothetical protein|nr:DUF2149 domain-containing protein [Oscillospiraceae bacterium]